MLDFKESFPIDVFEEPVVFKSKELKPTATLLSPVVNAPNTPIPTPVFPSAELKVPVEEVPTNKLFVKFVPACLANKSEFKVTSPDVPPPDKPVPATTEEISPVNTAPLFCKVPTIKSTMRLSFPKTGKLRYKISKY